MLVGEKKSDAEYTFSFPVERNRYLEKVCKQQGQLYYEYQGSHRLIDHPLVRAADIVHLHNLHGGYFNPFSISAISHLKPTVWTLHDMQMTTGHCAYSLNCQKWKTGCGQCHDLTLYQELCVDTTAQLWRDKKHIYDHSHLMVVAPSQWLKNIAKQGTLQNHPVELIYNGVDTNVFKPYDKKQARKKFGIPDDNPKLHWL